MSENCQNSMNIPALGTLLDMTDEELIDNQSASSGKDLKQELRWKIQNRRVSQGLGEMKVEFMAPAAAELTQEEIEKIDKRREMNRKSAKKSRERKQEDSETLLKTQRKLERRRKELKIRVFAMEKLKQNYIKKLDRSGIRYQGLSGIDKSSGYISEAANVARLIGQENAFTGLNGTNNSEDYAYSQTNPLALEETKPEDVPFSNKYNIVSDERSLALGYGKDRHNSHTIIEDNSELNGQDVTLMEVNTNEDRSHNRSLNEIPGMVTEYRNDCSVNIKSVRGTRDSGHLAVSYQDFQSMSTDENTHHTINSDYTCISSHVNQRSFDSRAPNPEDFHLIGHNTNQPSGPYMQNNFTCLDRNPVDSGMFGANTCNPHLHRNTSTGLVNRADMLSLTHPKLPLPSTTFSLDNNLGSIPCIVLDEKQYTELTNDTSNQFINQTRHAENCSPDISGDQCVPPGPDNRLPFSSESSGTLSLYESSSDRSREERTKTSSVQTNAAFNHYTVAAADGILSRDRDAEDQQPDAVVQTKDLADLVLGLNDTYGTFGQPPLVNMVNITSASTEPQTSLFEIKYSR